MVFVFDRMRRAFTRRVFIFTTILFVLGTGFWFSLPQPLFKTPYSKILLDADGKLLGAKISDDEQWRFPPVQSVPKKFESAIIAYEDKRFYQHPGVDLIAVARAIKSNTENKRVVSGASTLTMQVIRLASNHPNRSYWNKIKEAIVALRLELTESKQDILALYTNHAPFGGNVVGIEAAAWRYFGRSANELSWAESATLAVLPNQPSLIHLSRNRERLQEKRNQLLTTLHNNGAFDSIELELALLEPLPQAPQPLPQLAPHLFETLTKKFPGEHRLSTTLDQHIQHDVQEVMAQQSQTLLNRGIHNAAILVIDRTTMNAVAYVGNSQWKTTGNEGYALDLIHAKRSTGSILKPFLYAAMLQEGQLMPHTLVQDRPSVFQGYRPENFDRLYRGVVPASEALTQSLNIPAVRMLQEYGVENFYTDLNNLGLTTLFRTADQYGLPLILGGAETTLWEATQLYANLAKTSGETEPRPALANIHVSSNDVARTTTKMPFGPGASWLTLNTLLDVKRPGLDSHWRRFSSSKNISWKTGTSYGLRDGWAIGSNGRYTVGVWVGNATGVGNAELTGLRAAAPVLFDVFDRLGYHPWFEKPHRFLKTVLACRNDGYLANGRCQSVETEVPSDSYFEEASPFHKTIHLDAEKLVRVHNACELVSNMRSQQWFVLPPALEYFYQQTHDNYRPMPPYRSDCSENKPNTDDPIGLIYPDAGAQVYIPTDLDGKKSAVVFEAVHRRPNTKLYWHMDDSFLGETIEFHQISVNVDPGWHRVTLVDEDGVTFQRRFLVLGEN